MTENRKTSALSPLADPANVDFRLVPDEPDEAPGMTVDEAEEFLARPIEAAPDEGQS